MQKEETSACRNEMAGMMRICAGLVGPKIESVDFSSVFKAFLKVQRSPEDSRTTNTGASLDGFSLILEGFLLDLGGFSLCFFWFLLILVDFS